MALLSINKLNFAYGSNKVLENISLQINCGEFVGIIGPNGAGKTTLLKHMDGLLHSRRSEISIEDKPLATMPRRLLAKNIAYLPQEIDFAFLYTVHQVVKMGRYPYMTGIQLYTAEDHRVVMSVMELMDVSRFRDRFFHELSGGEKQRVMIASALAQQPRLLLLDEPTSALDLHHQLEIYHILKGEQVSRNLSIIVVTHDINLAAQYCDRMLLMRDGKIVNDGPTNEVLQFQVLQEVFGVHVYIDINPMTNSLYILPYRNE